MSDRERWEQIRDEFGVQVLSDASDEQTVGKAQVELFNRACKRIAELEAEAMEAADIGVHLGMHKASEREQVLKDRIAELEAEVQGQIAVRAMTVGRLGGEVEGKPAHSGNFLQRIDELQRKEAELAQLTEANRRIPVEERLPEQGVRCLVWGEFADPEICSYEGDCWHISGHPVATYTLKQITHWQPLPEGPK